MCTLCIGGTRLDTGCANSPREDEGVATTATPKVGAYADLSVKPINATATTFQKECDALGEWDVDIAMKCADLEFKLVATCKLGKQYELAEEPEVERPVDTPARSVKEDKEPTPLSQAEGRRSERSVEVLTNLEEGANPRHTEVEFHPQFVAAIQRVVEKVSNHPLRDQVIYNEGEKLAQRNREGDWFPSVGGG